MIHKQFINENSSEENSSEENNSEENNSEIAQVTFTLPASKWCNSVYLVGDFNNWDPKAHPFRQDTNGDWAITVNMPIDQIFQFRYLCDGHEWITDYEADGYVPNQHGCSNCLLVTQRSFQPHHD